MIKEEQIFLLDFGYSIKYIYHQFEKDEKGNLYQIGKYHYFENNNNKIIGTYSFMSHYILDGKLPRRKSEIENWFFVLIYLFRGKLPLSDTFTVSEKKYIQMANKRSEISTNKLLLDLPDEFYFIYDSTKKLSF